MIRLILGLAGLVLGLGAALLAEGRMAHLQRVAGARLPDWTEAVAPDASLRRGGAQGLEVPPLPGPLALRWRFGGLGTDGAHWMLSFGDGAAFVGTARLTLSPGGDLALSAIAGELPVAALVPAALAQRLGGTVTAEDGEAGLRPFTPRAGTLRWIAPSFDGAALGQAEARLRGDATGWRAPFTLDGGALAARGDILGRGGEVRLSARVARDPVPPGDVPRLLDALGTRGPDGWQVELPLLAGPRR